MNKIFISVWMNWIIVGPFSLEEDRLDGSDDWRTLLLIHSSSSSLYTKSLLSVVQAEVELKFPLLSKLSINRTKKITFQLPSHKVYFWWKKLGQQISNFLEKRGEVNVPWGHDSNLTLRRKEETFQSWK